MERKELKGIDIEVKPTKTTKKMKKLEKDLLFFKVSSMKKKNRGREETLRHLKQIKGIEQEIVRELKSTVDRKERENGYMQKALTRLEEMKKEKERLEKISEDKERKRKDDKEKEQRKQEEKEKAKEDEDK